MPKLHQYPAVQTPVFTEEAEEIFVDKWFRPIDEPILDKQHSINNGTSLNDPARLLDEEFTFTTWRSQYPDQLLPAKHLLANGTQFVIDPEILTRPEFPFIDKWLAKYPNFLFAKPYLIGNGFFVNDPEHLTDEEFPFVDKWESKYPGQLLPRKPITPGIFAFERFEEAEEITLDNWKSLYPDQIFTIELRDIGLFSLTQLEISVTGADIGVPINRSSVVVFPRKVLYPSREFAPRFTEAEEITVDRWFRLFNEPVRPPKDIVHEGWFVTDPARLLDEEFTFNTWLGEFPDQLFRDKFLTPSLFELPRVEEITISKWLGTYPEQLAHKEFVIPEFFNLLRVEEEEITLDKWFKQYPNPTLPRQFLIGNGLTVDDISHLGDEEFPFISWNGEFPDQLFGRRPLIPFFSALPLLKVIGIPFAPPLNAILEGCLDLEDLIDRQFWADAVAASGFIRIIPTVLPSGHIAEIIEFVPSGYVKKSDSGNLWDI